MTLENVLCLFSFLVLLLCFFSFSFCSQFFFFWELVCFFFQQQAQNHIRLLIKTDERKEGKDFETFLSLFFPLFDTNNTTLALLHKGREDEHALFFLFFFRVVKFYIEKDSKKRRAIDFDWFAHHPEAAAKNPKLTKRRLFITHINISLSLSRLIDTA